MRVSKNIGIILNREQGTYCSIGTSLALQALVGEHPDTKHSFNPLEEFDTLWVNIRTVFRNLVGSMRREDRDRLSVGDYVLGLKQDMENIESFVNLDHVSKKVVFYYSDYQVDEVFKNARFREAKTSLQLQYKKLVEEVINRAIDDKIIILDRDDDDNFNTLYFKDIIKSPYYDRAYIITHYPVDLIEYYSFSELMLLETHTGVVKKRAVWYTKYHDGNKLPEIPFNKTLLQIFGDKEMFYPQTSLKKECLNLRSRDKWNGLTTIDRIIQSFKLHGKKEMLEQLQLYL